MQRAGQHLSQPGLPALEGSTVGPPVLWVEGSPSQLRTEAPLPGEAAPHQPWEGTRPGLHPFPPPRSPGCGDPPFGEPPAPRSRQGHREGGISLSRALAPWMRSGPRMPGVRRAFQNIGMVDGHQQGADCGCVPHLARRRLPDHLGSRARLPSPGQVLGFLTPY